MHKVELLLPAGDKDCLRAAVANGADAVYLGLDSHNARRYAGNFTRGSLPSVVRFCHGSGVRVHVTANTLVKNAELRDYLALAAAVGAAEADAIIVQDPWLAPLVREAAPGCEVHLSTQATTANRRAVPPGVDRVILPREMGLDEIRAMASAFPSEVFVHGALCLSYSGQCLFSSIAGGRSGNRGRCAQPCRRMYDGAYPLSTRDLCLLERLPEIVSTGVRALKIEGRMRSPLYVATAARVYRKYVDMHRGGSFAVDPADLEDLALAFSRDFTPGFAFADSVVDASASTNRGVYLGTLRDGRVLLEAGLRAGDGVMALDGGRRTGNVVSQIRKGDAVVESAAKGELVSFDVKGAREGDRIFKNLSSRLKTDLGRDFRVEEGPVKARRIALPAYPREEPDGTPRLFVKVRDARGAAEAAAEGASVVYYPVFADGAEEARRLAKGADFFLWTPRVMDDTELSEAMDAVRRVRPDGVLAGERGLPAALRDEGLPLEVHLDASHNIVNDVAIRACGGIPVISPELSFEEVAALSSRRFISMVHGPLVLMTTREPLAERTVTDEAGRRFRVRRSGRLVEVLNCSDLGLYNLARQLAEAGVARFLLDLDGDVGKVVRTYARIIRGERFDDRRMRKGYTTGHFRRGVE